MLLNLQSKRACILRCLGFALSVALPGCGGGGSTSTGGGGGNPPAITSISPTSVMAGSGAMMLTVNGTGFVSTSVVQLNGTSESTTYVSSAKLTAAIPAAQVANGGKLAVVVLNGSVSSGTGTPVNLEVDNPAPTIANLSPSAEAVNTSSLSVIVTGTGFVASTTIDVNGSARPTTVSSATQAQVTLAAADVATAGSLAVTAVNPAPGGGTSSSSPLTVGLTTPTPIILSVSPNQILQGSPDTQISVSGTGFSNSSVVYWNGSALSLMGISGSTYGTILTATVPAADLTATGTGNVTVSTPSANPSLSNAMPVAIYDYPFPTVTGISPVGVGLNTPTTITVTGSGFINASVISINGTPQPTAFGNSTSISAQVPASLLTMPEVLTITVTTPAPGGGTSAPQYLTAYVPIANNSMVYNPANGLFYLSVPSAVGAPYGNSVVSIDPLTGALGTPIPVGSEPNRMALTADGKYLWVALDGAAAVRRVDLTTGTAGMQFPIPGGDTVAALAALPGAPASVVVSTYYGGYTEVTGTNLAIYDSGIARSSVINFATYAAFPWALIVDGTKNARRPWRNIPSPPTGW